jgi:hypothetical protein
MSMKNFAARRLPKAAAFTFQRGVQRRQRNGQEKTPVESPAPYHYEHSIWSDNLFFSNLLILGTQPLPDRRTAAIGRNNLTVSKE